MSGIIYVWNYFQTHMPMSGIISRHICQCLEIFPDKYVNAWNYFQTYMSVAGNSQCLVILPHKYVSVWNYFQKYISRINSRNTCLELISWVISRKICPKLFSDMSVSEISRHICHYLEIFPDIYETYTFGII